MIHSLVESNYTCVLLCIMMLSFVAIDRSFEKKVRVLFCTIAVLVICMAVCESISIAVSKDPTKDLLRWFTWATDYVCKTTAVFLVDLIVDRRNKRINWVMCIPLVINAALSYTTFWTGWVFYYGTNGAFCHGPLAFSPFATAGFYVMFMLMWTIRDLKKNGTTEVIVVLIIVAAGAITASLEFVFRFHYLVNAVLAVCLVFYYLFMYSQVYKRDTLTNLLNRRNFYLNLNDHRDIPLLIISIDINNLKKTNDTQGHDAGDLLITTVVDAVLTALPRGCAMYRTGGDEFMVLCRNETKAQAEKILECARKNLIGTSYSFASGISLYTPGMDIEEICRNADKNMYEDKRLFKLLEQQNKN